MIKDEIIELIKKSDYSIVSIKDNIKFIQVRNGNKKINIYWGKMTINIITSDGLTVLKDVSMIELKKNLEMKEGIFTKIKKLFI